MASAPSLRTFKSAGLVSGGDLVRAQELLATLKMPSPEVIAFVGAGVSKAAGYPTWDELLGKLHEEVAKHLVKQGDAQSLDQTLTRYNDMLWRAEEYRLRAGQDELFLKMLESAIAASRFARTHVGALPKNVVSLPFRHFLTTNYDDCLEKASRKLSVERHLETFCWTGQTRDSTSVIERLRTRGRQAIHVHGTHELPSSMILTNRDYAGFYLSTDRHAKQLFAIFATFRLCFLGFSLTDPHILRLLDQVEALGHDRPRHFAVLCDPGDDIRTIYTRMLEKRYGVSPIFYRRSRSKTDGKHRYFSHFIAALVDEWKQARSRRVTSPRKSLEAYEKPLDNIIDPDDLNRGRFGRKSQRAGLRLLASVTPDDEDSEWFVIKLVVEADPDHPGDPLQDRTQVTFHLHDTFPQAKQTVRVIKGRATLERYAWGAFTVGAVVRNRTCLELDLSRLHDAPPKFRGR